MKIHGDSNEQTFRLVDTYAAPRSCFTRRHDGDDQSDFTHWFAAEEKAFFRETETTVKRIKFLSTINPGKILN